MKTKSSINLVTAILININIILGAGLFINPKPLTLLAGPLGFIGYILAATIIFPIVLCIAQLAKIHPTAGGLYVYSKEYISPFVGFISGWSYFLGKTTSAALLAHVFVSFFQRRILFLQQFPILLLDCFLILLLILLNIIGLKIGGKIQYFFTSMKAIPIIFVLFAGLSLFNLDFFTPQPQDITNLFSTFPVAIFVLLSFEMICSIGHLIKNPEKNISRAILYSFFIVATIAAIFQFMIFGSLGTNLKIIPEPILAFGIKAFNNIFFAKIINSFVFVSIIGGSFGSLTANCWNLYRLADGGHLPGKKYLTKINKTNVPYFSLLIEGGLGCLILWISKTQIPLQNMTVLGMVMAYFFSSVSAFLVNKKKKSFYFYISILAITSSFYIAFLCIKNLILYGISFPLLIIFIAGLGFSLWEKMKH
jgi:amino acid transporter